MSSTWKNFLIADSTGKVIQVFKNVFLGVYFFKLTNENIPMVCLFYIIFYMSYFLFLFIVNRINKLNLLNMFKIGLFLSVMQCVLLLIMQENINNYIIEFALFCAIGNAFYYYPEQLLIKRVNKLENYKNYVTKDITIKYSIEIFIPIILGFCITYSSYTLAFIILFIISLIGFIFSLNIKDIKIDHAKFNIKKFYNKIKNNGDIKLFKWSIIRVIFRGLSSFGVLATLISLITYLVVKTEFSLGSINGLITIVSIIIITIINNYISKKTMNKIFMPAAIIQVIVILLVTIGLINLNISNNIFGNLSIGFVLVFIYNLVNAINNPIFESSNTVLYYETMDREKLEIDEESTYIILFEIINISRSIGYAILLIVSLNGFTTQMLGILIAIFSLFYLGFAYTIKHINTNYLNH